MSLSQNSIPQGIIQEVAILNGKNNLVQQNISQNLIIYLVSAPDIAETASINTFLQTNSDIGVDNQVSQNLNQTMGDFPLFPNHFVEGKREDVDKNNLVLDYNDFIGNDDILDSVQFTNQQIIVEGNNNDFSNSSEQIIYDLSWYDEFAFNQNNIFDNNLTFDDFLEDFVGDYVLDSVQFAVQDIVIRGNRNSITQDLEQTIATFIVLDDDFIEELSEDSANLSPVQLVIQEDFIDTNNNQIEQNVTQNISFDFSFSNEPNRNISEVTGEELEIEKLNFNIDDFILPVLENTNKDTVVFANQDTLQKTDVFGDKNTDIKENSQILVLSETDEIIFAGNGDDTFAVGLTNNFDGLENLIFTGAGNDTIDISESLHNLPNTILSNNKIHAGSGNDEIIGLRGDRIFAGNGDDILKTATGGGKNRFYGEAGNDEFFVSDGGGNIISGGLGEDIFWLINNEIPSEINTVIDFNLEDDFIGIKGLGDNPNLSFESGDSGNTILMLNNSINIANFLGIQPSELEQARLIIDNS